MTVNVGSEWIDLHARMLRAWPLPEIPQEADKEVRGRVLVIAGSREIPGAALLAGTAALRAGAGKLVIGTARSVADQLAFAVPEARVIGLPETPAGSLATAGVRLLEDSAPSAGAVLVGPGLMDEAGTRDFMAALLPVLTATPVVLDALAMNAVKGNGRLAQPILLTPHAGEMAHLLGRDKEEISAGSQQAAIDACNHWNAVVALKGPVTFIAGPQHGRWRHDGGGPGLATSGSGDVLAGLIAGFAAQQAPLEQACAWGVVLHALAGARLARRLGPLGYLARELPAEIPPLLKKLRRPGFRPSGQSPTV
jgi:ADP-dependent NAD(P)H-hydrate dehydratase